MDFDLADALDDKNDRKDPGRPDLRPGEGRLTSPLCPAVPWELQETLPSSSLPDTTPTK